MGVIVAKIKIDNVKNRGGNDKHGDNKRGTWHLTTFGGSKIAVRPVRR